MPRIDNDILPAWELAHFSPAVWAVGFHGLMGLDWSQIRFLAEIFDIQLDRRTMTHLQIIEKERLKAQRKT